MVSMPILYARLKATAVANRENVAKLDNFVVINQCADIYTNIDIVTIDAELDYALKIAHLLELWLAITAGLFFLEIFIVCVVPISIMFCCKSWTDDDSDYQKSG